MPNTLESGEVRIQVRRQAGKYRIPFAKVSQYFVTSNDARERTVPWYGYEELTWDGQGSMLHNGTYKVLWL